MKPQLLTLGLVALVATAQAARLRGASAGGGADAARLRGGRNLVGVLDKKPAGHACTFDGDCVSNLCTGPLFQKKCAAGKLADGTDCQDAHQCASGRCLPKTTSQGAQAGPFSGGSCVAAPDYPGDVCDVSYATCSSDAFAGAKLQCSASCTYASDVRSGDFFAAIGSGNVGSSNIKACCLRNDDWVDTAVAVIPRGYKPSCGLNIRKQGQASNWMSTQYFTPAAVNAPRDLAGVVAAVNAARSSGRPLKAVGGCASMSSAATTDGTLVHTYLLNKIEGHGDPHQSRLFWLETGVTIYDFITYLSVERPKQGYRKLAMPNLGGWTGQTVVGAVSTSTHGSGTKFAPLGDFVRAIHLVAGDGRQYVFEPKTGARFTPADFPDATLVQDDEEFYSSVVTFGSLGVVYRVLYEALPWFQVKQTRVFKDWSELKQPGAIKKITDEYDHVELWLNMYKKKALVTQRQRHYDMSTCDNGGQCGSCLVAIDPTDCAEAMATNPTSCSESTPLEAFCLADGGGTCARHATASKAITKRNCPNGIVFKRLTSHGPLTTKLNNLERDKLAEFKNIRGIPDALTTAMDAAITASMTTRGPDGNTMDLGLNNQAAFTDVQMDYQYIFDTSIANLGTVLTSEVNVPFDDAAKFGSLLIEYAAKLAADKGANHNFYSAFASMRFTAESKHHMAQSYGSKGGRTLMEGITGQRTSRYNAAQLDGAEQAVLDKDQRTLVDGWAEFALDNVPEARMHFGLQNKNEWDAKTIAARYPAHAYASLVDMDARYDPRGTTSNAFETRIIDKAEVRQAR